MLEGSIHHHKNRAYIFTLGESDSMEERVRVNRKGSCHCQTADAGAGAVQGGDGKVLPTMVLGQECPHFSHIDNQDSDDEKLVS